MDDTEIFPSEVSEIKKRIYANIMANIFDHYLRNTNGFSDSKLLYSRHKDAVKFIKLWEKTYWEKIR